MRFFLALYVLSLAACTQDTPLTPTEEVANTNVWFVTAGSITGGTTTFEVMDTPEYNTVMEIDASGELQENSKLALLAGDGQVYAFPYYYTNYYEVVNVQFDEQKMAISFCPITKSAICFDRELSTGELVTLKASGYLYNDNMVPTDTNNKYFWSQMATKAIRGEDSFLKLSTFNIFETTWSQVKLYFPTALVFTQPNVDHCNCDAAQEPLDFGNLFGVISEHVKEDQVHLFNYDNFSGGTKLSFLTVNGKSTVVAGNREQIYFNAFYVPANTTLHALDSDQYPRIMVDDDGNIWDAFGYAVSGPKTGDKLKSPKSYVAAEWAWNKMFEGAVEYH
ncbi:DUF3179 domain-containing protein [Flavobacteriaceae bacterium F89]|uniref:DUF3179 domain-containing protein n=1 Tax=Cerina litoralis TaxID=2874477 RepID=A0AAE3ESQ9_9FLAO|nr:DUF3179 domain-containing (seleno)protein [Cerina litoralis]MCG2459820.1 DUF3179 domain-containing protein [Cerina litoralis]